MLDEVRKVADISTLLRFIVGFGLFRGWVVSFMSYSTFLPSIEGTMGLLVPSLMFFGGGGVLGSALCIMAPKGSASRVVSVSRDILAVVFPCMLLASTIAPSAFFTLACCASGGLLCGFTHCSYGLVMITFERKMFVVIVALAMAVASVVAVMFLVLGQFTSTSLLQVIVLMALQLGFSTLLKYDHVGSSPCSSLSHSLLQGGDPRFVRRFFLKALIAFFLVSTACRVCDTFTLARLTGMFSSGISTFASYGAAASLLLVMALKNIKTSYFYRIALPCSGIGFIILVLPPGMSGVSFPISIFLIGLGFEIIEIMTWVLVSATAQQSANPLRYLGGYALVVYVSSPVGKLLSNVFQQWELTTATIGLICVVLLVFVAFVVFPEQEVASFESLHQSSAMEDRDSEMFDRCCRRFAARYKLTDRETEVLAFLARGRTLKVIAEKLVISKGTAGTHIANVYRKTDVHSQQDLIDLFESYDG